MKSGAPSLNGLAHTKHVEGAPPSSTGLFYHHYLFKRIMYISFVASRQYFAYKGIFSPVSLRERPQNFNLRKILFLLQINVAVKLYLFGKVKQSLFS